MKIERVVAGEYGPLRDVDWTVPDVSVVYDDNMTGKTSLVDILIRSLFLPRKGSTLFDVPGRFAGHEEKVEVAVSDGGGTYTFHLDGTDVDLKELLGWKDEALFRLLCIRAGDSRLVSRNWERSTVMNAVASLVSGAKTEKIERVESDLLDSFGITEGGDWSNRRETKPPKIKDRITSEILPFLQDFSEVKKKLVEAEELTADYEDIRSDVEELEEEADELRGGLCLRRRKRLERLVGKVKRTKDELSKYSEMDSDLLQEWKEVRSKLSRGRAALKVADYNGYTSGERLRAIVEEVEEKKERLNTGLRKERDALKGRLRHLQRETDEGERAAAEGREEENDFIFSEVHRPIARIRRKKEELGDLRLPYQNRGFLGFLFGGLMLIGVAAPFFLNPLVGLVGVPGSLGLAWLLRTGVAYNRISSEIDSLEKEVEGKFNGRYKSYLDERVYGIDRIDRLARDLPNKVYMRIREERKLDEAKEEITRLKERLEELGKEKEALPEEISRLKEREKTLRGDREEAVEKIRGAREKLTKLRKQAGVDDLEELEDLVEAKRKSEEELREARGTLAGELEVDRTGDDDLLMVAEEEMERLAEEIESVGRHSEGYDGREVAELKEREKNVREELREKRRKLKALEDRVDEIKATLRKRNLDPGEPRVIFDRRDEYLRELRNFTVDRLAGNLAREALDRVSSEYFETLDAYLGRSERREGNVGEFFSGVMGDEFEVEFDFERDEFIIHEGDVEYSEKSLSSGGKRHLLYATRLALLEGIPTDPAFLILDDPYLFYHKDRKGKAVRQLKKFVKKGWQVLCFTVDRETMNLMVDELGAGYFEIGDL